MEHAYPEIGREVPDAIASLKFLQSEGADIILWTMRSDSALKEALHWCHERGIRFYGVNVNPDQSWTRSPKAYAHYYIDDAAVGCPLVHVGPRPYVDWQTVVEYIMEEFADG